MSDPCSSFDMDSSLSMTDGLEISVNKSKDRTKVDQESKVKTISEVISSNSGKGVRAGKECVNYYRSVSSYGHNKKNCTVKIQKNPPLLKV